MQIEAGTVKAGDYLYDADAYHPSAAWVRVISVTRAGDEVGLHTERWSAYYQSARQGVTVRRKEDNK